MSEGLRIVSFNIYPTFYALVAGWAAKRGHRLVLMVTTPAPVEERYGGKGYRELIATVPREQEILIARRLRATAAPAIRALQPDLILAASFPHRIPEEVTAIPRFGAFNLHTAPLPRGRGPYPERLVYEGDQFVSAVLHRIAPEFDSGAILSRARCELPAAVTSEAIMGAWMEALEAALDQGVARAVAGEPGDAQDESRATTTAPFSEAERSLRWDEPALTVQRRAAALNLRGPAALARIDGKLVLVDGVRAISKEGPAARPGAVLQRADDLITIGVADGAVEMRVA